MQVRIAMAMLGSLFLLSACGGPPGADSEASVPAGPEASTPADEQGIETSPPPAGEESVGAAAPAEDDSGVTAQIETVLGDADVYKMAFTALQTAVAANDKTAVAKLADYPLTISVGGQRVIADADQFVKEYDRIITPEIAKVITAQKFADVLVNTQGVMFGNGEVWLSGSCEDEACGKQVVSIARIQQVAKAPAEFPLTMDLSFSDAAAKRLADDGETVVVGVSYFGFATPAAKDQADDLGMVDLGTVSVELAAGTHKAVFDGSRFRRDQLQYISGGPRVNINVFSGRHSSGDNILDCDSYEDSLANATSAPITLNCKLLRGE